MRCDLVCGSLLGLVVCVVPVLAQGVQPLVGSYRYVRPSLYFGGSCGAGPVVYFEEGTLVMAANGTFSMAGNTTEICAAGVSTSTSGGSNSSYTVASDGTVLFDFDPNNPGTNTARMFLRPDGSVMLHTPDGLTDEGTLALGVRLSSGRSNGSLIGSYHVVKVNYSNGAAGISAVTELGVLGFDGAGGCSGTVTRRTVTASGATSSSTVPIAGSYVVAPDGQLRFPPGPATAPGAVSADGEMFFAADVSGSTAWLVVGVRSGPGHVLGDLQGLWGMSDLNLLHGTGSALPVFSTDSMLLAADAAGACNGQDFWVECQNGAPPAYTGAAAAVAGSAQLLSGDGSITLQFTPAARATRSFDGAISADSCFVIGFTNAAATSSLLVGLRRPPWPAAYGTATPGAGQIAPMLRTAGGFPYPGNANLALVVDQAVGGGFAVVCFATRPLPAPGLPLFGGSAWIDPSRLFGWVGVLTSGTFGAPGAGAAAIPLPLPSLPSLRGMQCFAQAVVFDASGPQGFAFSPGLDLRLAR